ncbi:hypothetical protein [Methylobacterium marchantiae]|uniref:Uncharacterized protein n=1 Tax=Methylobacterium marchantiae TaxID=600331 RepID=A0ABW3X3H9_9HYPH|nr:hypothetical protein AIGOOFII_3472 [Methylobacterium marchantiae]
MRFRTVRRALIEARYFRKTYGMPGMKYRAQADLWKRGVFQVAAYSPNGVFLAFI